VSTRLIASGGGHPRQAVSSLLFAQSEVSRFSECPCCLKTAPGACRDTGGRLIARGGGAATPREAEGTHARETHRVGGWGPD
jgi:hypothetical protein